MMNRGTWWATSAGRLGARAADHSLGVDAPWAEIVASGRADIRRGFDAIHLTPDPAWHALDVGCGIGRTTAVLAELCADVIGIDVSPDLLARARTQIPDAHVRFLPITDLTWPMLESGSLDLVFSAEVIHHLEPAILASYIRAARRVLKLGGYLILQVNAQPATCATSLARVVRTVFYAMGIREWRGWPTDPGFRRYVHQIHDLTTLLKRADFHIECVDRASLKDVWIRARRCEVPPRPIWLRESLLDDSGDI